MTFFEEFIEFLNINQIEHSVSQNEVLCQFHGHKAEFLLVPLDGGVVCAENREESEAIYLFEDRWRNPKSSKALKKRILAHLGQFRRIMARKCTIRRIDAPLAKQFLEQNHSYGYAAARYKYGMFFGDELVAVSLFSAPRAMTKDRNGIMSYEWVRYASLADCRISGGMGKMLAHFVNEIKPQEVMSYADFEWSNGKVYTSLGFRKGGVRASVDFWIDPITYERRRTPPGIRISNLGSIKYLLTI